MRNEKCTRNKFRFEGLEIIEIVDLPTREFSILNSMRQHGEMELCVIGQLEKTEHVFCVISIAGELTFTGKKASLNTLSELLPWDLYIYQGK